MVDRKKDMIISGGENIYCAEVENALATCAKVAEVAIIGVPDPKWGETPMAVVVPRDPANPPTDDEIEAHCRQHLARYKHPRRLAIVDALPRNASGKVLKTQLRQEHGGAESYAAGPTDTPLLDETIGANFEHTASAYPDIEALVDVAGGRRWTYAELNAEIDRVARALMAIGIQRGDGSAFGRPTARNGPSCSTPRPRSARSWCRSIPRIAPTSYRMCCADSARGLLVSATAFKTSDYRRMVNEIRSEIPGLVERRVLGHQRLGATAASAPMRQPVTNYAAGWPALNPSDPINIQYTSGTTGSPKGAILSHRNILNNGFFVTEIIKLGPGQRLCIPVPFYHCFGMVMGNLGCTTHAATMVIPAAGFDPAATLEAIEYERCTGLYGVPTMFIALLGHPDLASRDVSSLRTGIMAGASCPMEVMRQCVDELNLSRAAIAYGMTETSPVSCQTPIDDDLATEPPRSGACIRTSRSRSSISPAARSSNAVSRANYAPVATR